MKDFVKRLSYRLAPRWTTRVMSERARAHSHRVVSSWGNDEVAQLLVKKFGNKVQEGPFAGLTLTEATLAEQIGPYLLGVYESELDEAWNLVFQKPYAQILDVGAKFGYYAVGLARRFPQADVVAFDTDSWARETTRDVTAANGVGNVRVEDFCDPQWILRHLKKPALILSDCEGYEATLFSSEIIPLLTESTLIIETHDCFVPGISDELKHRFSQTHQVKVYGGTGPRRTSTLDLSFLSQSQQQLATAEVRTPQTWLLCSPQTKV